MEEAVSSAASRMADPMPIDWNGDRTAMPSSALCAAFLCLMPETDTLPAISPEMKHEIMNEDGEEMNEERKASSSSTERLSSPELSARKSVSERTEERKASSEDASEASGERRMASMPECRVIFTGSILIAPSPSQV